MSVHVCRRNRSHLYMHVSVGVSQVMFHANSLLLFSVRIIICMSDILILTKCIVKWFVFIMTFYIENNEFF